MRRGQLSGGELFWVAFAAMFPTIILLLPGDLLRISGRHAWVTPLLAAVPAGGYAWAVGAAAGRFGDLVRTALRCFGPVLGRAVLLAAWLALGVYIVLAARESVDLSSLTFIYREVPVPVLDLFGLVPAAFVAWLGPVVSGRMAALLMLAGLGTFVIVLLASLPAAHIIWALPLLPHTLRFAAPQALDLMWCWLAEPAVVGAVLVHRVSAAARRRTGPILAAAVAAAALATAAVLWVITATLGTAFAATLASPFNALGRGVSYGSIQHLETLILALMVIGAVLKLAIFFLLWARLGAGLAGGWSQAVLAIELVIGGVLGVTLVRSPGAANQALLTWTGLRALPVLAVAAILPYAAAALGLGASQR